jgi:hypothetical protein
MDYLNASNVTNTMFSHWAMNKTNLNYCIVIKTYRSQSLRFFNEGSLFTIASYNRFNE